MSANAKAVSTSGRPSLKNLTRARVPRAGVVGVSLATVAAISWQFLVSKRHEQSISAFYKHYDPERDYARMKSAGVFKTLEGRDRPEWLNQYESELDSAIAAMRK